MKRQSTQEPGPKPRRPRADLNQNSCTVDWLLDRCLQAPNIPDPILDSIELSDHPHPADLDFLDNRSVSPSRAERATSRTSTSCPEYRDALMKNGVIIDNIGTKMPAAVHDLVAAYLLKGRLSPPLEPDTRGSMLQRIQSVWSQGESSVHRTSLPALAPTASTRCSISWIRSTHTVPVAAATPLWSPSPSARGKLTPMSIITTQMTIYSTCPA